MDENDNGKLMLEKVNEETQQTQVDTSWPVLMDHWITWRWLSVYWDGLLPVIYRYRQPIGLYSDIYTMGGWHCWRTVIYFTVADPPPPPTSTSIKIAKISSKIAKISSKIVSEVALNFVSKPHGIGHPFAYFFLNSCLAPESACTVWTRGRVCDTPSPFQNLFFYHNIR